MKTKTTMHHEIDAILEWTKKYASCNWCMVHVVYNFRSFISGSNIVQFTIIIKFKQIVLTVAVFLLQTEIH